MRRCPECGRGGRGFRLSAPELATLAAGEVADGEEMADETFPELILLRKELRRALRTVNAEIDRKAEAWVRGERDGPEEDDRNEKP